MRLSCDPNEILWYAMSSPFRREMKAKALFNTPRLENFIPDEEKTGDWDGEIVDVGGAGYPQLCLRA